MTDDIKRVIFQSLDTSHPDHCMFWAACTLAFFGFLRSAEFTEPTLASFFSSRHLEVRDIEVDSATSPTCMCVRIKASKTNPFREGCSVHIGLGVPPLCAVQSMMLYLGRRGQFSRAFVSSSVRSTVDSLCPDLLAP